MVAVLAGCRAGKCVVNRNKIIEKGVTTTWIHVHYNYACIQNSCDLKYVIPGDANNGPICTLQTLKNSYLRIKTFNLLK